MSSLVRNATKVLRQGDAEPAKLAAGSTRIYSMRFCPFAERVLLYATVKNIPSEVVNIHLRYKPSWYFDKHPKGQVPTFEKDGKYVIESGIIPEYLDGVYPETSILPKDPYERAQQRIIADQLGAVTQSVYGLAAVIKGEAEGAAREEKLKAVENALDTAEKLLTKDYYGGSTPGYADWLAFPFFERVHSSSHAVAPPSLSIDLTTFPSPTRWPKLSVWYSRLLAHPAVQAVSPNLQTLINFQKEYFAGNNPNFDLGL